jgi:hypothetical protein
VWTPAMSENHMTATAIARELNPENTSRHFEPGRD